MGTNVASQKQHTKEGNPSFSEQVPEGRNSWPGSDEGMLVVVVKYWKFHLNMKPNFFQCGWSSPGMGCPERLWGIYPSKYSQNPIRSAICSGWPCLEKGVGLCGFQRCLQTSTTLWFCEREVGKARPQAENDVGGVWQQALEEPCRYTKRASFPSFQSLPPQHTPSVLARREGGEEKVIPQPELQSSQTWKEQVRRKTLPALGHAPGRLARPLASWHFSDLLCRLRG